MSHAQNTTALLSGRIFNGNIRFR